MADEKDDKKTPKRMEDFGTGIRSFEVRTPPTGPQKGQLVIRVRYKDTEKPEKELTTTTDTAIVIPKEVDTVSMGNIGRLKAEVGKGTNVTFRGTFDLLEVSGEGTARVLSTFRNPVGGVKRNAPASIVNASDEVKVIVDTEGDISSYAKGNPVGNLRAVVKRTAVGLRTTRGGPKRDEIQFNVGWIPSDNKMAQLIKNKDMIPPKPLVVNLKSGTTGAVQIDGKEYVISNEYGPGKDRKRMVPLKTPEQIGVQFEEDLGKDHIQRVKPKEDIPDLRNAVPSRAPRPRRIGMNAPAEPLQIGVLEMDYDDLGLMPAQRDLPERPRAPRSPLSPGGKSVA